jgi:tetratricopeptide (TPR) repeat protein
VKYSLSPLSAEQENVIGVHYATREVSLLFQRNRLVLSMLTLEEIRKRFELSKEFNEIFDAFEQAIQQRFEDMELYRQLFWNNTLTPDEVCLFGEKLVREFPNLAYDVYMWLASVFEVTYAMYDNYERTFEYYKKASSVRPTEPEPYLEAADCYEPDLNIPPISQLIEFLKRGAANMTTPKLLYQRLAHFYELVGNDEMLKYYRQKLDEGTSSPPQDTPPTQ